MLVNNKMPIPKPKFLNIISPSKNYFNVLTNYNPGNHYILTRTTKYDEDKLPEIAFFGTNEEDIRSYKIGNNYYQWKISKSEFERRYGKIINLYSTEAQQKIKKLDEDKKLIVEKALKLGDKQGFKDKIIRVSEEKKDDIEAFKIIKGLFPEFIGSFTPGKDRNPIKNTLELSHNEIVLWDKIDEINTLGKLIKQNNLNSFSSVKSSSNKSSSSMKSSSNNSSRTQKRKRNNSSRTQKRKRNNSSSAVKSSRTKKKNTSKN